MPIYEYKCAKCNHDFEQLQKVTDNQLLTCPKCGKDQLVKLISNTSFQLKGTGWYVTDFKNKKEKEKDSSKVNIEHKDTATKDTTNTSEKSKSTESA